MLGSVGTYPAPEISIRFQQFSAGLLTNCENIREASQHWPKRCLLKMKEKEMVNYTYDGGRVDLTCVPPDTHTDPGHTWPVRLHRSPPGRGWPRTAWSRSPPRPPSSAGSTSCSRSKPRTPSFSVGRSPVGRTELVPAPHPDQTASPDCQHSQALWMKISLKINTVLCLQAII